MFSRGDDGAMELLAAYSIVKYQWFDNSPLSGQSKTVPACFQGECIGLHTAVSSLSLGRSVVAVTLQLQAHVVPPTPTQSIPVP